MKRTWIYLNNPFLTATAKSFRLAVRISTQHDSALLGGIADVYIAALYAVYHPFHVALMEAYTAWVAQGGLQQGKTLNLTQLLKLLAKININAWDAAIQAVYAIDTPEYMGLLPNGHKPFQTGTQTQRMAAVSALIDAIGTDASLAVVKAVIVTFNNLLTNANTVQKGSISITGTLRDAVEAARIVMGMGMYADLGSMINNWPGATENIEQYYDLESIRKGAQVFFTNSVKALKIKFIAKRTFDDTSKLRITNTGLVPLHFFLSENKTNPAPGTAIVVNPGEMREVFATELGPLTNLYLRVYNPDGVSMGDYDVEIL
jgi:hypothetical protein